MTNQPFNEAAWARGARTVPPLTRPNGKSRSRSTLAHAAVRYLGGSRRTLPQDTQVRGLRPIVPLTRASASGNCMLHLCLAGERVRLIGAAASRAIPAFCQTIWDPHSTDASNDD